MSKDILIYLGGTLAVLAIHLGTLKWNIEREKIRRQSSSPFLGAFILSLMWLWAIYVFWFQGFKIGIICLIFYLVVSYFAEKILGLDKVNTLQPWKDKNES